MTAPGRIEFRDVPVPPVGAGQVLVRMKRIGVCGSDGPIGNVVASPR
jgi:L-iditol 2-dehydrogenase